jgi:ABC-type methionine transport system permease subunit
VPALLIYSNECLTCLLISLNNVWQHLPFIVTLVKLLNLSVQILSYFIFRIGTIVVPTALGSCEDFKIKSYM